MVLKTVQCNTVRRCDIMRCNLLRRVTHVDGHSKWIDNARRVAPLQPEPQTLTLSLILMSFIHSVILDTHAATHTHTHTHAYKLRHINTLATVQCIVLKLLPDHPLIEDQSKHVTTDVKLSIGRLKWTETEITLYSPKAWLIIEFNRQFKLIQDNKIRI